MSQASSKSSPSVPVDLWQSPPPIIPHARYRTVVCPICHQGFLYKRGQRLSPVEAYQAHWVERHLESPQ